MTSTTGEDRSSHGPERRRSIQTILEETDEALRSGTRPGAQVWPTGFDLLDSTLDGGLRSGELVLIGGGEGSGKTTLAAQFVRNAVRSGRHAIVFSFEHEAVTLLQRLISLEAAMSATIAGQHQSAAADVHAVRAVFEAEDPDRRGLAHAMARVPYGVQALLAVQDYAPRLHLHESNKETTPQEIARLITEVAEESGEPPMVLVDYLQKIPLAGHVGDEVSRVTQVTETLKDMALDLKCPVVAITAADREGLGAGHRMRTRDLRGSSALAYEADLVLILSSKEHVVSREHLVYDLGSVKRFRRWAVITVEKNRHGLGQVELEVQKDFEHGRFHPDAQVIAEQLIEERVFTT
ncbi:DnaB-like helicase C-terminal domain-containing protein [Oryzobacter sp. R7]|uniref:DnaB-like helicase C-terminal domain-containing protein n=1 Tax=Oryzobacter faecalis TaxID=3388656 RepID=UPI00398D0873